METRSATVALTYNDVSATASITPTLGSFSYTDVASGSSDSISVELTDKERRWTGPWFPEKGDTLKPIIQTRNWDGEGDNRNFPCGTFQVDDFGFSRGPPIKLSLQGLAIPSDSSFKTTERTITYEDATLKEIGQEIAGRAGISLVYEADTVNIKRVEQTNQTDCDFYNKLVTQYGFVLKIYDNKLVVFSEATYEGKAVKLTLTETDLDPGWSWDTALLGTYTGIKYQYTNADKNKTFTVEAGGGKRIKTSNTAADNLAEAISIALAELNEANKGTTMSATIKAVPGLIASDCVEIKGLGKIDGKYYIEKITHNIGDGYKMNLEMRRVEKRFTTVTVAKQSAK